MSELARGVAGLVVWAIGFSLLYGIHGIACSLGWQANMLAGLDLHRWAMLGVWGLTIAAGGWLVWAFRAGDSFWDRMARIGAIVGVIATIATGMPVVAFPGCGGGALRKAIAAAARRASASRG